MPKPIAISEAESLVMQVLWGLSPQTAEEVIAALSSQQDWQVATIKTLLNRLLKKHARNRCSSTSGPRIRPCTVLSVS